MITHPDDRQLNDFTDDVLPARERAMVQEHLATCVACRDDVERLRRLRAQLAALPRDVPPPAHVLAGVHTGIAGTGSAAASLRTYADAPWYGRPRMLAAAAVLLIVLSSSITALVLRGAGAPPAGDVAASSGNAAALVAVDAMERSYEDAIAEVQRALLEGQSGLSPETVRVLETNLALIDRALEEARTALRADPGNDALTALLRSGYERKLDVLRSVSSHARARS